MAGSRAKDTYAFSTLFLPLLARKGAQVKSLINQELCTTERSRTRPLKLHDALTTTGMGSNKLVGKITTLSQD